MTLKTGEWLSCNEKIAVYLLFYNSKEQISIIFYI